MTKGFIVSKFLHKPVCFLPLYFPTMFVYGFSGSDCRANVLLEYSITSTHIVTGLHKQRQRSLMTRMKENEKGHDVLPYPREMSLSLQHHQGCQQKILNGATMGWVMIFMGWHRGKYKSESKSKCSLLILKLIKIDNNIIFLLVF